MKFKVYETRKRSIVKAITFRVIEVGAATILFSFFITPPLALGLAAASEGICMLLYFLWERLWNKIDWERNVTVDDKDSTKK